MNIEPSEGWDTVMPIRLKKDGYLLIDTTWTDVGTKYECSGKRLTLKNVDVELHKK